MVALPSKIVVGLVVLMSVGGGIASTHAAPIYAAGVASQSYAITTAILIGASSTRAAVEKSDAVAQAMYQDLKRAEAETRKALKRANNSEAARQKLEAALRSIQKRQEDLMAQLAAKDAEYEASLRAYREGLTGLLAESDPRVVPVLERYAEGDTKAADDLQALTRIIRKARDAGLAAAAAAVRTKNGDEQRTVARLWADEKDKGRKTTTDVLAAWQEAAEIDPSDFWQWIEITRLHQEAGDPTSAARTAQSATNSARTLRDRSVALDELAGIAVSQGRLDDARRAYDEYHDLARQLLASNPSSAQAKRDVSISLSMVGNVAVSQGRLDDAGRAYEESHDLLYHLLTSNPSSAGAKRDVSISLQRVGYVAVSQGRLDDARGAYVESRDLARQLLAENLSSAVAKRDVGISLQMIGTVAVGQGHLDDARRAYEEFSDLARQLLTANPSSAEAKRDVSVSLEKVGNVAMSQGRLDEARWAYEQSLAFARQLLASNPSSAEAKRDVSISLQKVGDVAVSQGRLDDAGRAYEEDLDLARQLLASNPSSAQAKRDVLVSNWKLALIPGQEQNWRDALAIAKDMAAKGVLVPADQWMMPELQRQVDALDAHK